MKETKPADETEGRIAGLPVEVPEGWSVCGNATRCRWSGPWNLTVTVERMFTDPVELDVGLDYDFRTGMIQRFKLASATVPADAFDISGVLRAVSSIAEDHGPGLEALRNGSALSLALSDEWREGAVGDVRDVRRRFAEAVGADPGPED